MCKFSTCYLTVIRNSCIYFVTFEDVILIFLRDLKTKLCKYNKKEVESVHYVKAYAKAILKSFIVYVETSDPNLLYQLRSKPLSQQRLWSKIDQRCFTFAYCLIFVKLDTMFKVLAFWSLCLVPNKIDFVLSWPKCILNILSTDQSHKLKKSLGSCFSMPVPFLCWKTMQVPSA